MRNEFEFINNMKSLYSLDLVGDDCAVLPQNSTHDLLITSDMLVEDVDFSLKWTDPETLGHKALAVSLSDIAAMGGSPEFALLSIAVSEKLWKTDFLDRFYQSWHSIAQNYGVELAGGDISRVPDRLVIDSTVLGSVPKGRAIWRSGARPGDGIYVSGSLGGAAAGLAILEKGDREPHELIEKQLKPTPQISLGKQLQQFHLATAMIDVSDGLGSDLSHICESSGVGAIIRAERVPIHPSIRSVASIDEELQWALSGGEDFELLFTADPDHFAAASIKNVTQIGEITGERGRVDIEADGQMQSLGSIGFRHF
jgi:thiamine-monophosphate kinase